MPSMQRPFNIPRPKKWKTKHGKNTGGVSDISIHGGRTNRLITLIMGPVPLVMMRRRTPYYAISLTIRILSTKG
jgi:hypothetical protein